MSVGGKRVHYSGARSRWAARHGAQPGGPNGPAARSPPCAHTLSIYVHSCIRTHSTPVHSQNQNVRRQTGSGPGSVPVLPVPDPNPSAHGSAPIPEPDNDEPSGRSVLVCI